jgi:pimeloyl-ACP methyl ester carboxylesterase
MNNIPFLGRMRFRVLAPIAALAIVGIGLLTGALVSADPAPSSTGNKPTIVLVHGAWADGSSWSKVSKRLQDAGYDVRIPPNNLRGIGSDAADIANYLKTISGPIVLAAHSYGGAVITNAAAGNGQVRSLVYVDAFIPAEGETLLGLNQSPAIFAQDPANVFDVIPYQGAPQGAADLYVKPSVYGEAFAEEGLSRAEIGVLAASQRPLSTASFTEPTGRPAWATIPSWAVIGEADRIIPAAAQISMAQKAGSRIVKIDAPHLSMLTDAQKITDVITRAARETR